MKYSVVADIFSQISRVYDRFLTIATMGRIHRWQRELISRMHSEGNWLDVGTGTGEVLIKLGESYQGSRVGIDPAFGMLLVAKNKCRSCYFVQSLGESLPFKEGSFKNISLSLVFRHLEDKRSFIQEANRVLESGGRVGIIDIGRFRGTPAVLFLMKTLLKPIGLLIFGRDKWSFFIHSVEESYSIDEVKQMFDSAGFKNEYVGKRLFGIIQILVFAKTA
ncbi:demethylmenaquinone methyltransferase/2-methoxy-6-polyprenyl-1,4-benzoquinol methylase [Hydrogenivirga caldilitoris]|uniref:Demethylmenaquinone methyltransferase/2-methoxy-6-polyprenyl-1,4-benzoquinol methylase n=1 Tax=Hydrogenivirga caldilitoris TaxID=246264 RepID=A0A497XRS2_9AQUI|nr:class I SAM-dependent methyltransferase [Hydrogenivirga caldilitoris]RLJ70789.1 demethylmenaquinone methyltransferase/2-methoxy-6-polyprenyl-1,4-benzoquinol methylase [Hydrogenivirga caldilitoris]